LQPHPNNDLHKFPAERAKGIAGSVIIHLVLFVLLLFLAFTVPPPPEKEEGILVNFGTDETGLGDIEPSPPPLKAESAPPATTTTQKTQNTKTQNVKSQEDPLLTQNNEEAPEVKKVDPDAAKKRKEKLEADKILKEQKEAERAQKAAEDAENKRIAAEQQRQTDIMNRTKNALANSKNAGTSSTSEGIAGGTGNQGDPNGSIDSKVRGHGSGLGDKGVVTYDLKGRGFQALPEPKYDYQEEGKVVVEVSVDRQGKVIQATPGIRGSTTLNEYLLKVAKEAALKAQFEVKADAPSIQKGTITYNFILK
jgi:colicin import membrane protein